MIRSESARSNKKKPLKGNVVILDLLDDLIGRMPI